MSEPTLQLEIIHSGETIDIGDAVARITSPVQQYLWLGNIPSDKTIYLRIDDKNTGDISKDGFKIEILMSGSHKDATIWQDGNAYVRLYEQGSANKDSLDDTESADDVAAGWGKYLEITTDHQTGSALSTVYKQNFMSDKMRR